MNVSEFQAQLLNDLPLNILESEMIVINARQGVA